MIAVLEWNRQHRPGGRLPVGYQVTNTQDFPPFPWLSIPWPDAGRGRKILNRKRSFAPAVVTAYP